MIWPQNKGCPPLKNISLPRVQSSLRPKEAKLPLVLVLLFSLLALPSFALPQNAKNAEQSSPPPSKSRVPADTDEPKDTPVRNRPPPPKTKRPPTETKRPPPSTGNPNNDCTNQCLSIGVNLCVQVGCKICDWRCQLGALTGGLVGGAIGLGSGFVVGQIIAPGDQNGQSNAFITGGLIGAGTGAVIGGLGGLFWTFSTRAE